jgi:DNA-binding GntR family transcriptional regulator
MKSAGVSRDALTDRSYELLRDQIIDGRLAPDERLQIDRLSRDLGVSHTPIREALNRLASDRLVNLEPYKGFRVAALLDASSLRLLFEARRVIELGALRDSVERAVEQDRETLQQLFDKLEGLAAAPELDIVSFNEMDAAFHRLTVVASRNVYLLNAYDDLHIHVQIARCYRGRPITDSRRAQAEHRAILEAFLAGDREALLDAASAHITSVCERLITVSGEADA